MDKHNQDTKRKRCAAATASALVMALLMAGYVWLMVWAFHADPIGAPPMPLLILLLAIPAVVIIGVGIALVQRIREIGKNEVDDAKDY